MAKAYTYCEQCDNVVQDSRKRHPAQWLCSKFPRVEGGGFVAPQTWVDAEPFMRCKDINGGDCPLFKPIPEQKEDFQTQRVSARSYEQ